MKSKILWFYAAILTVALVGGFVRQAGLPTDAAALAALQHGQIALLGIEVAAVWIFAALAIKARIFEPEHEIVHDHTPGAAAVPLPETGVFARHRAPRL